MNQSAFNKYDSCTSCGGVGVWLAMQHPVFINFLYKFLYHIRMIENDKYHYYYEVKWEKGVWGPNLVSDKDDMVSLISETKLSPYFE